MLRRLLTGAVVARLRSGHPDVEKQLFETSVGFRPNHASSRQLSKKAYDADGYMKAVTFHGPRDIRVTTQPVPIIEEPTDIVVQVRVASICGSDMHPYAGRGVQLDHGQTFGHEFVGTVCATGDQVQNVRVGDRVASAFSASCGECFFCRHELTCRCTHSHAGRFGYRIQGQGPQGTQAEFARVPLADTTVLPVPETISDTEALMLGDILPTGWYCAAKADIPGMAQQSEEGVIAVVVGCGPVGLMAILAAQAQGASKVFALDRVPDRLQLAREFGAEPLDGADMAAAESVVREASRGRGADCVMEAVGSQATLKVAFDLLRIGGTLSSVGLHTDDKFTAFSPWEGYSRNFTYRNGRCSARVYMNDILDRLQSKFWGDPFPGNKIISHRVSMYDEQAVRNVYNKFEHRLDGCTKVLLEA